MNVCGILVHSHPERIDALEAALAGIPGVEAHGRAENARLIVTVEDTPQMPAAEALAQLNKLPGVIAAALVYHEFDPDSQCTSQDASADRTPGTEDKPC